MFEISVSPSWEAPLLIAFPMAVFVVSLIIEVCLNNKNSKIRTDLGMISFATLIPTTIISGILLLSGAFVTEHTGNNPASIEYNENSYVHVQKIELKEKAAEEIEADSLMFEAIKDKEMFLKLRDGDFVNFEGIRDDSKINGSVYFTKDSMIVLIEDKNAVEEKIVVPAE